MGQQDDEHEDVEFHDEEDMLEEDAGIAPDKKDRYFEFTNNFGMMRLIRSFFFIQVIAVIIDNPTIELPILFHYLVSGICYYSLHFYSRPFIDLIYAIQYSALVAYAYIKSLLPGGSIFNIKLIYAPEFRRLAEEEESGGVSTEGLSVDFIGLQSWHSIQKFSHFFLGLLFTVMAILFTIRMWEIKDYSNAPEIQQWVKTYAADGWQRRGGFQLAKNIAKACFCTFLFAYTLFAISQEFSARALPTAAMVGVSVSISLSVVAIIWVVGMQGFKATVAAFERYVSQNVNYTSLIILKRVVKAKTEIAIGLVLILYLPVLSYFLQSIIVIQDWNTTLAQTHRKNVNFYVPCYFMAFPPYKLNGLADDTCPIASLRSSDMEIKGSNFYYEQQIVQCDSYYGAVMYTTGFVLFNFVLFGYVWFVWSLIDVAMHTFQGSNWVEVFLTVRDKVMIEDRSYKESFPWFDRFKVACVREYKFQTTMVSHAFNYFVKSLKNGGIMFFKMAVCPLMVVLAPLLFYGKRIFLLCCNSYTAEGRVRRLNLIREKRREEARKKAYNERFGQLKPQFSFKQKAQSSLGKVSKFITSLSSRFSMKRSGSNNDASPSKSNAFFGDSGGGYLQKGSFSNSFAAGAQSIKLDVGSTKASVEQNFTFTDFDEKDQYDVDQLLVDFPMEKYIGLLMSCCGLIPWCGSMLTWSRQQCVRAVLRNATVSFLRVQTHFFLEYLRGTNKDELHGLGNDTKLHGQWRKDLTITSREDTVYKFKVAQIAALRKSRVEFVADHSLVISVLDYTVDSAAMFMLICQYHWDRLYFSIFIMLEMTVYVMLAAPANYFLSWKWRLLLLSFVNFLMMSFTYIMAPYTEEVDKWIDFIGRILIFVVAGGLLLASLIIPPDVDNSASSMYRPWEAIEFYASVDPLVAGLYITVDAVMVLCFYCFIFGVLQAVGMFSFIQRYIISLLYSMHDHILDFLIEKVEERTLGVENVYTGLLLVQQWDDIIREQRRYGLLPWPDVRPQRLLSFSGKLFEVKWASLFNLSITNLRSSLGLSLLHTAMYHSDGEVCRWLVKFYPELLMAEDSQRDSPLGIALKECSYYLCKFAKIADGQLDDGTSYDDESNWSYYPEILDVRDEVYYNGEFLQEQTDIYILNATESLQLKEHAWYEETKYVDTDEYVSVADREEAARQRDRSIIAMKNAETGSVASASAASINNFKFGKQSKKIRRNQTVVAAKHEAIVRYPEDGVDTNFESGQFAAWKVVGMEVPDDNIFMDYTLYAPGFTDFESSLDTDLRYEVASKTIGVAKASISESIPFQHHFIEHMHEWGIAEMATDTLWSTKLHQWLVAMGRSASHFWNLKTVRLLSCRNPPVEIERDPSLGPEEPSYCCWPHTKPKTAKTGRYSARILEAQDDDQLDRLLSRGNANMGAFDFGYQAALKEKESRERTTKWKICRFAEILLSDEIRLKRDHLHWNIVAYAQMNKMASQLQGQIAQNLAMACNLKPPEGFARFSEWAMGIPDDVFEEANFKNSQAPSQLENTVVKIGNAVSGAHASVSRLFTKSSKSKNGYIAGKAFSNRVIQYLAECYVSSRDRIIMTDCEMSGPGRIAFRAIFRAARQKHSSFVLPSLFVAPKTICIRFMELQKNELDDGDMILLADAVVVQQELILLDISFNRVGCRGLGAILRSFRGHKGITTFRADHNRIGPTAGIAIGVWLKQSKTIKVASFAHNRMGAMVRYTSPYVKETVPCAAKNIFMGLRVNKSLHQLDISYNHMGPECADIVPISVNRHPKLSYLDISGNDLGPTRGPAMIFALAGLAGGDKEILRREAFFAQQKLNKDLGIVEEEEPQVFKTVYKTAKTKKEQVKKMKAKVVSDSLEMKEDEDEKSKPSFLAHLGCADNQMGLMGGHAIAALFKKSKSITSLDVSGNALGPAGGLIISEALERVFNIASRDAIKRAMDEMQAKIMQGRNQVTKKAVYTNLVNFDLSRNNLGSNVVSSLMLSLASPQCTILNMNVADNPLGHAVQKAGSAVTTGLDIRQGLGKNLSLISLDLSTTSLLPAHIVPIFGGLAMNSTLIHLHLHNTTFDEPSCLQLSHAISACTSMTTLDIPNSKMGPKGASLVMKQVYNARGRIKYFDISHGNVGLFSIVYLSDALNCPTCAIRILKVSNNDLREIGGCNIGKALLQNHTITELDISHNGLTNKVAQVFADIGRGIHKDGKKIAASPLVSVDFSNNPEMGFQGSRLLIHGFTLGNAKKVNFSNIGAGPATAAVLAKALRRVTLPWAYVDISFNQLSKSGMNEICWSLRQNRRIRIFKLGHNEAGPHFCTDDDILGVHGLSMPRAIRENVVLRELDLGYTGLSSGAGVNIFEALAENFTIRKVCLRGNHMDDDVAYALKSMLVENDVIEELDLGDNRMSYNVCFVFAEMLETNRSLVTLRLDQNRLGSAGMVTVESFCCALVMNCRLRTLVLDQNRLGPEWGIQLAGALSRNNTLIQVSLIDNRFDMRAGGALLRSYTHNPYLRELAVTADEIGAVLFAQFQAIYRSKRAIVDPSDIDLDTAINYQQSQALNEYY